MPEPDYPIRKALTAVSCGFSSMPIFSHFMSDDGFVQLTAFATAKPRAPTYGLLKVRQEQPAGPLARKTAVDLARAVLARYGQSFVERLTPGVVSYRYVTSDAPSALSLHDQMVAIRYAREVVIAAGLDPDLIAISQEAHLNV
jgi:hypothetical protein